MKRITDIVSPALTDHSNCRDRDQSRIVTSGVLDTISK